MRAATAEVAAEVAEAGEFGGGGDSLTEHRYNLTFSISARNLLNHVNYATPVGFLSSPNAFQPLGIAGGYGAEQSPTNNRRLDLQLRFRSNRRAESG